MKRIGFSSALVVMIAWSVGGFVATRAQEKFLTPSYLHCIATSFNAREYGWYTLQNNCTEALNVLYMAKLPPYGSSEMTLRSGQHNSTGDTRADVDRKGGFALFVCPKDYMPVDSTSNTLLVRRPDDRYRCKSSR